MQSDPAGTPVAGMVIAPFLFEPTRRKIMADKNDKLPENVPGKYYDDKTCTPCHTCMEVAGVDALLKYNDDETYVYFHKQPATEAETNIAEDALAICPTGAIGND